MTITISKELMYLFICLFNGFVLTMLYDLLRIFRRIIRHNKSIICLEDIIYGVFIGTYLFKVNFDNNDGTVRLFVLIALVFGGLIYSKLVSNSVVCVISRFFIKIKKKLLELLRIVAKITINKNIGSKKISKFRKL